MFKSKYSLEVLITAWIQIFILILTSIYLLIMYFKKVKKEIRSGLIDIYKLIQLLFMVMFILTRTIFGLLWFVPNFEFFYLPILSINTSFFYYFELINDAWWLNFIMYLDSCHNSADIDKKLIKKIKHKERILLLLLFLIIFIQIFWEFLLILLSIGFNWQYEHVYFTNTPLSSNWNILNTIFNAIALLMLATWLVAAVGKIFIGWIMLRKMKKGLNFIYK